MRWIWWRYSWLLLTAFVAVTLAFFSLFRIGFYPAPQITFRQQATWQSMETLRVAQSGFPTSPPVYPGPRMPSLASVYAALATDRQFRALVSKSGPLHGRYQVAGIQSVTGMPLPVLRIEGQATSPAQAAQVATRVSRTLRLYITQQETRARIPQTQRVRLAILPAHLKATLIQGHWRKGPLIALSVVLVLLLLAALVKFAEERRA